MGSLYSENVRMQRSCLQIMINLTERQQAVFVGSLLGDAHIQKSSSNTGKCRVRFCHSGKQKQFVDWKYEIFKTPFCEQTKAPYFENRRRETPGGSDYLFYTSYRNEFIEAHSSWYVDSSIDGVKPKFVKQIPLNISEILHKRPLSLAVWFLDDGSKRSDTESCRIASQSFSKNEHKLLQDCLFENFGISAGIEDWGRSKTNEVVYFINNSKCSQRRQL